MRLIEHVLGSRRDEPIAARLHQLEHRGTIDSLVVKSAEMQRRRFRATTTGGEEVAIALPRDQCLHDGAVLVLDDAHALIVQVSTPRWLRFVPRDAAAAIELGYHAGNLHWRVKFDGPVLMVAQEGEADAYRARLRGLIDTGRIVMHVDSESAPC